MIHMKIDMEKLENKNPEPHLEDGEYIECFSVPLNDLYHKCTELESEGFAIDGKLGAFIEGIQIANFGGSKVWNTSNSKFIHSFWHSSTYQAD